MQDLEHWKNRWATGQTGWHVDEPHPLLAEFAQPSWERVLVPLCGASLDLGWFADQGKSVVGVDVSEVAARRVFEARNETPSRQIVGEFEIWSSERLQIAVGDMFAFSPDVCGTFDAVWDRASLVAIPPSTRDEYAAVLRRVAPGAELLLAVFEYDPKTMDGPPHSVPTEEVGRLVPGAELLREDDLSGEFADRGRSGTFVRKLYRARLAQAFATQELQ